MASNEPNSVASENTKTALTPPKVSADASVPPTVKSKAPQEALQEIRFAVVMYGGLSLAVYMNGIAQELLRLVRSTGRSSAGSQTTTTEKPESTEVVYRKLGQMLMTGSPVGEIPPDNSDDSIRTRFIVDILSGSSAGGINAIFLAKALANDELIEQLKELWKTQADIKVLLNDKKCTEDTELNQQQPPRSMLSSNRMYWELLKAFDGMDKEGKGGKGGSRLVEELDLFVTTTDFEGQSVDVQLSDKSVQELRYKNVFHFAHTNSDVGSAEPYRADFVPNNNPFLAFAARCTSAHPAAFEPMNLRAIDDILRKYGPPYEDVDSRTKQWRTFYERYLKYRNVADDRDPEQLRNEKSEEFRNRYFTDGGVLDNQPFSYTIDTLPLHHSDLPVTRKLIYIEPAPEHPKAQGAVPEQPEVFDNAWRSLSTLPSYEPIREHLQKVLDRNRLIQRIEHITQGLEEDVRKIERPKPLSVREFMDATLTDKIKRKGTSWGGYQRLRVAEVTDQISILIMRVAHLDEESDLFQSVRYIVRYWRSQNYKPYAVRNEGTEHKFLFQYDIEWRLRRLRFVLSKLNLIACFDDHGKQLLDSASLTEDKGGFPYPRWSESERKAEGAREKLDSESTETEKRQQEYRVAISEIKTGLNKAYKDMLRERTLLWSRHNGTESGTLENQKSLNDGYDLLREFKRDMDSADFSGEQILDKFEKVERDFPLERRVRIFRHKISQCIASLDISLDDDLKPLLERYSSENERTVHIEKNIWLVKERYIKFRIFREVLETAIAIINFKAGTQCRKILGEVKNIEKAITGPTKSASERINVAANYYYEYFDDYDMVLHPLLYSTDAGVEIDYIDVFRISPEDAPLVIDQNQEQIHKLAGVRLAHFGAFFEDKFRANDILWGRLDCAERMISVLLPAKEDDEKRRSLIKSAHNIIIDEEVGIADKTNLNDLAVSTSSQPATGITDERVLFALGARIKSAESIDHFRDEFRKNYKKNTEFNNRNLISDAARAGRIFSGLLHGISARRGKDNKAVIWLVRITQFFWALVELALPQSITNILAHHWLSLLYLTELIMFVGGTILLFKPAQEFALIVFIVTVIVNVLIVILEDAMSGPSKPDTTSKTTGAVKSILKIALKLIIVAVSIVIVLPAFAILIKAFGLGSTLWNAILSIPFLRIEPVVQPAGGLGQSFDNLAMLTSELSIIIHAVLLAVMGLAFLLSWLRTRIKTEKG